MYHPKVSVHPFSRLLSLMAGGALLWLPLAASAESSLSQTTHTAGQHTAMTHQTPVWAEKLKGQTIVEDTMEGRPERAAMVERQHERIMMQMQQDPQLQQVSGGMYNNMSMMHQYGAGGQDLLLMSDPRTEPVAMQGGRCPTSAPVRKYDISAINVEISINQWLDYYPGYMYVLTENIDKVREEEAKNKAGREKEGHDPGAVANGLQSQWIQPLVIRGNQGDCIKITLQNTLEGGEDVSLHIHGSSMVVGSTGKAATTTNPDSIVAQNK
ncbi:MAG: hypothetical protein HY581_04720, partial [Nitrospirae bacterium]|nr:hypothetical protein [Nitrospirota bacterium]